MQRLRSPLPLVTRLAIWLTVLTCVAYGLMNTSFYWTLTHHDLSWSTRLLTRLIGESFFTGSPHLAQWQANYARATDSIGLHAAIGGAALTLCALQFVPGWRQRSPRTHRLIGWAAIATCVLSMASSLAYLNATPLQQGFGGPIFGVGLWLLALSTLQSLTMGVLRARQRRWREHMGWMTLTSALLMTAPLLRTGYVAVGNLMDVTVDVASAWMVGGLTTMSFWLCLAWVSRAGQRELPLAPAKPVFQPRTWLALAMLGAAGLVHEAVLAPQGLDLSTWFGAHRPSTDLLPRAATAWALLTLLVLPEAARALGDETRSQGRQRLPRGLAGITLAQGLLALWTASPWAIGTPGTYEQAALAGTWAFSGASATLWATLGLAGRLDGPDAARARTMGLVLLLAPCGAMLALPLMLAVGLPAATVLAASASLGLGWMAFYAVTSAFGLPLPGAPATAAAPTGNAPA
ncbi:MAG: hypothetical protein RI907_2575 [Pseudomonadota bacterium]|jgi:uncharacterized membrane protein